MLGFQFENWSVVMDLERVMDSLGSISRGKRKRLG